MDSLNASIAQFTRNQIDDTVATTQALLQCRSLSDMSAVQSRFLRDSFERFVHQANHMAQAAANMAKQQTRAA